MLLGAANAEAFSFRSLLSFLSKNDQVGVMAKDKHSRVSFIVPMYLREGHVAARLYYGSLDTLEQARDEALQQSYINAIAEQANASLNPSSSTSSSPVAVAVVSPSLGPDELSNSESEAQGQTKTETVPCLCRDEFCEECNGDDNNGSLNEDDRKKAAGA